MATRARPKPIPPHVRCYTRALKNARHLQKVAPDVFRKDPHAEGFGTGLPMELLRGLHRIRYDSPVLNRRKAVAETLEKHPLPALGRPARDALFSGTVHFAQVTFHTSGGDKLISTADMNQIVQYAQHAVVPISDYASQYGLNTVTISPTLLTKTVNVPTGTFTDNDLQGWVNALKSDNNLPSNSCVFVVVPQGISANEVGGNAGYHSKADIPYIVAGVTSTGLTLADVPDVYAMVVSHEIAEMVVDPNVASGDPEVCDACDINCGNLTRIYFDAADKFLGSNQATPPGGFTFSYYICSIVKPAGASDCPASAANCNYAPVTLKFRDDIIKPVIDITLKFNDDITLKFRDDIIKPVIDVTLKFNDDIKLKFKDDIKLKFKDDIGPGPKGPSDVKMAGFDIGPEGPGGPGAPVQFGGLSGTPFILATPHHSMAWAGTAAAQQASRPANFEDVIPQYEAALAELERAMQEGSLTLQQIDAQYRQMLAEYQAVVDAYRAQTDQQSRS
jgi:hypothetical protein